MHFTLGLKMADNVFCTGFFYLLDLIPEFTGTVLVEKLDLVDKTTTPAQKCLLLKIFLLKNSSLFSLKPLRLPAWSLSKSLPCVLLPPGLKPFFCYFKALMMSLLHL